MIAPNTDLLIYDGGTIKALDNSGRVGGYLIVWGGPEDHDATPERDYFTPQTELGRYIKTGLDIAYHHGLPFVGRHPETGEPMPNPLADVFIGETIKAKKDDVGLWMEAQLGLRTAWEKAILKMVNDGKLGLSSGAAPQFIRREKQKNGASKITRWPVIEASITPSPGEPRTSVTAIKSLIEAPADVDAVSVFFPAELGLDTPESSEKAGVAPASPSLDDWAGEATSLVRRAAEFHRIGPTKRAALKALRAALDDLLETQAEGAGAPPAGTGGDDGKGATTGEGGVDAEAEVEAEASISTEVAPEPIPADSPPGEPGPAPIDVDAAAHEADELMAMLEGLTL